MKGQIMDVNGDPIPGLYSAGELGSVWGMLYQCAGNIGECIAFGRIAGTQAVAEKLSK
jgi:predicted oxidoreductase